MGLLTPWETHGCLLTYLGHEECSKLRGRSQQMIDIGLAGISSGCLAESHYRLVFWMFAEQSAENLSFLSTMELVVAPLIGAFVENTDAGTQEADQLRMHSGEQEVVSAEKPPASLQRVVSPLQLRCHSVIKPVSLRCLMIDLVGQCGSLPKLKEQDCLPGGHPRSLSERYLSLPTTPMPRHQNLPQAYPHALEFCSNWWRANVTICIIVIARERDHRIGKGELMLA